MPRNATLRHQRFFGGAFGVIVLGFALTYHFFPGFFHVAPAQAPRRAMSLGGVTPAGNLPPQRVAAINELNAGPPLTLAPTAVIVARNKNNASLPEQKTAETAEVRALLERAVKALHAGQLAGAPDSAAALFMQALKEKPDSRRAVQGLFDVRARLVAEIDQDIAVGDVDAAEDLLSSLRTLPNAEQEVAHLEANLQTLATVRPMLTKAAALLQAGKADQPAGGSALDLYRQVQQLDPQNAVAEQGIFQVQRAVLDRALAAVAQNDFAGAEQTTGAGARPSVPARSRCTTCRSASRKCVNSVPAACWPRRAWHWMPEILNWRRNWQRRHARSIRSSRRWPRWTSS